MNIQKLANSFNRLLFKIAAQDMNIGQMTNRISIMLNAMMDKKGERLRAYNKRNKIIISDNSKPVDSIIELTLSSEGNKVKILDNKMSKVIVNLPISDIDRIVRSLFNYSTST